MPTSKSARLSRWPAALLLVVSASAGVAAEPLPGAQSLPANVNAFLPASTRDPLDSALIRLAKVAESADLKTNEPWLFDRPTAYYKLWRRTGDESFRKYAFQLVEQYYSMIGSDGYFKLKPGDNKYSYVDGAVWYEHETHDQKFRSKAQSIYQMWIEDFRDTYSPSAHFWTEREMAYAFGSAVGWYELTQEPKALARARKLLAQWDDMSKSSGAPLHTLMQHSEEFDAPWGPKLMSSPWMSAFFFEYVRHYYTLTHDRLALELVSRYADFMLKNCLYDGALDHPNLTGYLMPNYLCGEGHSVYTRETPQEADGEHTPDVMGIFAFAVYAKRVLGQDPTKSLDAYRKLRTSAEMFVARRADIEPARKINWWLGTSYDATYLVQAGQPH